MKIKQSYDVVIVGAGPVGVAMASLLGKYKISTLLIDREPKINETPRAISLCEEGSRVLSAAGVLETFTSHIHNIAKLRFDRPYGKTMAFGKTDTKINGYPTLRTYYQPDLERCLRASLDQYDHVDLSVSTTCLNFQDHGTGVSLNIDKDGQNLNIHCRFMIASDGSNSTTRKTLGINFQGKTYGEDWIVFDAEYNPLPDDEVVLLCDPDRPGITMSAPNGRRRWEFLVKDTDDRELILEDLAVAELLKPWGDARDMALTRKTIYTFHARIADSFQKANVFLIGDAAHITPPFAGQGLMAGFRDCYNLAWKIRDVLGARARPQLLETYETDRKHQVKQIIWFAKFVGAYLLPPNRLSANFRDLGMKLGRLLGAHSDSKPIEFSKIPNHINGNLLRHIFISKWKKIGFEFPQHLVATAAGKAHLIDHLMNDHHYLISINRDPSVALNPDLAARWRAIGGRFLMLDHRQPNESAAILTSDYCLRLLTQCDNYRTFFARPDTIIAIRPDKMIIVNCPSDKLESKLDRYLLNIEIVPQT
jgi:3-(3-hydroxy-phenyl)propionate hydroxylase